MYKNLSGNQIPLGEELGKGAAAQVFLHGSDSKKAIKIFHAHHLAREAGLAKRLKKLHEISRHIHLYVDYKSPTQTISKPVGSLPEDLVFDAKGRLVGFVMPTIKNGIDLSQVVFARDHSAFFKYKHKPFYALWYDNFTYGAHSLRNRFILCYNLAHSFGKLYKLQSLQGIPLNLQLYNFDIKPANILVSLEKTSSSLHIMPFILDLDNLTLKNETGVLAPDHPQFTPEYKAPEGPLDHYYDYFSIAVIFYQLIFNIHPFEGIQGKTRFTDGTNRDFFMQNQCFPWGKNGKFLEISPQHANFKRLPEILKDLFVRALDAPARHLRPDMAEWQKGFVLLLKDPSLQFDKFFKF
jgi:DNA-binding helix-hairpin-helix protein with protein kinase domain